jgi:hypothetical protein
VAQFLLNSQIEQSTKVQVRQGNVRFIRNVAGALLKHLTVEVDWFFQHFSNEGGNLRALTSGQGDVGKERMALQGFNNSNHTIMAANPQVIPLGNIMS